MTAAGGAERLEAEGKRGEDGEEGGGGHHRGRPQFGEGGGGSRRHTAIWRERGGGGRELVNPDEKSLPVFVSAFYVLWGRGAGNDSKSLGTEMWLSELKALFGCGQP